MASRSARGDVAGISRALRKFGESGSHVERVVGSADGICWLADHEPERAVYRMEGGDDRDRRRDANAEQRHAGISSAEFTAARAKHSCGDFGGCRGTIRKSCRGSVIERV